MKLEESEESNRHLQKLHRTNQALLEKKTAGLADMEKELLQARTEREELSFELEKLRKQANFGSALDQDKQHTKSPKRERTPMGYLDGDSSPDGDSSLEDEQEAELVRLQKTVRDLSVKLQSSVSYKKQLEREMEDLVADNTGLSHTLERMEGDLRTLQLRLDEANERSADLVETSEPTPPSTPKTSAASSSRRTGLRNLANPSGHSCSTVTLDAMASASLSSTSSSSSVCCPSTAALSRVPDSSGPDSATNTAAANANATGEANELSLFSELGDEYSSLQHKYHELLASCVCSHGGQPKSSKNGGEEDPTGKVPPSPLAGAKARRGNTTGSSGPSSTGAESQGTFKELFDELFSTLRETAQVADKLIEGSTSSLSRLNRE